MSLFSLFAAKGCAMTRADMKTLQDIVAAPGIRPKVVGDCAQLIDDEVKRKSGLSGLAIKGAYGLVKAIKPGIIKDSIEHLLDGFVAQLEPYYVRAQEKSEKLGAVLVREPAPVADALLHFTDQKAERADNATMRKAYSKLRPTAKDHVQQAVPGLAAVLDKYVA